MGTMEKEVLQGHGTEQVKDAIEDDGGNDHNNIDYKNTNAMT